MKNWVIRSDVIQEQHELVNQKLYQAISKAANQSFSAEKLTDIIYYVTLHKKEIGESGYDQALRMLIHGVVTQ